MQLFPWLRDGALAGRGEQVRSGGWGGEAGGGEDEAWAAPAGEEREGELYREEGPPPWREGP